MATKTECKHDYISFKSIDHDEISKGFTQIIWKCRRCGKHGKKFMTGNRSDVID